MICLNPKGCKFLHEINSCEYPYKRCSYKWIDGSCICEDKLRSMGPNFLVAYLEKRKFNKVEYEFKTELFD